jgi:glucose/arabinose dehydrogenase
MTSRPPRYSALPAIVVAGLMALAACTGPTGSPSLAPSEAPSSAAPSDSPSVEPSSTPVPTPNPTGLVSGPASVTLEEIAGGFVFPTAVTNAGDGSGRLFVVERRGQIHAVNEAGVVDDTPFLDISGIVRSNNEQGLLGLAFHPDYPDDPRFWVAYTRLSDSADVVAEYRVSSDPDRADPASERVLLAVPDPAANHNGGGLAFGPDRYLYVSMGDGGGQNDQFQNGQNVNSLLGKMLRLDVGTPGSGQAYTIPVGNPFATGGGAPEIWAYGLRNPWRFSFDRVAGDLYIGDVGGGNWEEIDLQEAGASGGQNYGWPIMEGAHCLAGTCSPSGYVPPIAEYDHDLGCAIVGGYVHRGTVQTGLNGAYLFADWCSGLIFTLDVSGTTYTPRIVLRSGVSPSAFGEEEDGELVLVDFNRGGLYRVVGP